MKLQHPQSTIVISWHPTVFLNIFIYQKKNPICESSWVTFFLTRVPKTESQKKKEKIIKFQKLSIGPRRQSPERKRQSIYCYSPSSHFSECFITNIQNHYFLSVIHKSTDIYYVLCAMLSIAHRVMSSKKLRQVSDIKEKQSSKRQWPCHTTDPWHRESCR